jgi:hypothetical protein
MLIRLSRFQKYGKLFFILVAAFITLSAMCDYWSPGLESRLIENGGTYVVWWFPDDSPSYQVSIEYPHSESIFKTAKAETLILRTLTMDVTLSSLNKYGQNRGYMSDWSPTYARWEYEELFPLNTSDSIHSFGCGFDSFGYIMSITWQNLNQAQSLLAFWVDSTGTELVGTSDTNSPGNQITHSYLAIADSIYPDSLLIAPPVDTVRYHTRVALHDSTSYWLWIDCNSPGYDSTDHFALLKVNYPASSQVVEMHCGYQPKGGLRWLPP